MSIGEKLKKLRESNGKTQMDLAKYLNVNYQTIYKYEKNIVIPPVESLIKLCDYFNVPADYLLGRNYSNSTDIFDKPLAMAASMKDNADLSEIDEHDKEIIRTLIESMKNKKK